MQKEFIEHVLCARYGVKVSFKQEHKARCTFGFFGQCFIMPLLREQQSKIYDLKLNLTKWDTFVFRELLNLRSCYFKHVISLLGALDCILNIEGLIRYFTEALSAPKVSVLRYWRVTFCKCLHKP